MAKNGPQHDQWFKIDLHFFVCAVRFVNYCNYLEYVATGVHLIVHGIGCVNLRISTIERKVPWAVKCYFWLFDTTSSIPTPSDYPGVSHLNYTLQVYSLYPHSWNSSLLIKQPFQLLRQSFSLTHQLVAWGRWNCRI